MNGGLAMQDEMIPAARVRKIVDAMVTKTDAMSLAVAYAAYLAELRTLRSGNGDWLTFKSDCHHLINMQDHVGIELVPEQTIRENLLNTHPLIVEMDEG